MVALVAATLALTTRADPADAMAPDARHDVIVGGAPITSLSSAPLTLNPTFSPAVHDYTLRCATGTNSVTFTLGSNAGDLQVGRQRGASVGVTMDLVENDAAVIRAPSATTPGSIEEYWIRCLPQDFPVMNVTRPGTVPAGYYLTGTLSPATNGTPSGMYAMVLDTNGTPVWYQRAPGQAINVNVPQPGTIAWVPSLGPGFGTIADGAFRLYDVATQTSDSFRPPVGPLDPHEFLTLPNGNRMVFTTPLLAGVDLSSLGPAFTGVTNLVDCVVSEVDPAGQTTWTWRMSDHVDITEALTTPHLAGVATVNGVPAGDLFHCNSIDADPSTGNVLLSARHLNAVMLVNRASGQIVWKLGGTPANHDGAPSLTITGDSAAPFSGQHDARFRPNGDVSLFDDRTGGTGAARGVEYAIDTTAGTATLTWQYASPDGVISNATGSFRRSADGTDNVIGWGFHPGSGFTEVDASGQVLMNQTFPNGEMNYRTIKVAPDALDLGAMRRSAGAADATPGWDSLGGIITTAPAAVSWAPGRTDVFARGTDGALYHRFSIAGTWSIWESLGGGLNDAPAVTSAGPGRLDVVVRGTDDGLWRKSYANGAWSNWSSLGGIATSAPAVAAADVNHLAVFVRGTDGALWQGSIVGGRFTGWVTGGGVLTSAPAAASWGPGRYDVFVRGTDSAMYHRFVDGGAWSGWEYLGGVLNGAPAVAAPASGVLDVVVRGTANGLYRRAYWVQGWGAFTGVGVIANSDPAVSSSQPGVADIFAGNSDGTLGHRVP